VVPSSSAVVIVKPVVKVRGKAKVASKLIAVARGGVKLTDKKKSVRLVPGVYKITTTVKYRTYVWKTKSKAVTRTKVGVAKMKSAIVRCTASRVERHNEWSAGLVAECASKKFNGKVRVNSACTLVRDSWSCREDPAAVIGFLALPKPGKVFDAVIVPWRDLRKTVVVKPAVKVKRWSKTKTKKRTETIRVTAPPAAPAPAPPAPTTPAPTPSATPTPPPTVAPTVAPTDPASGTLAPGP
jgi:hypothetical protein